MTDELRKQEMQQILSVLGNEGILDTLLCVKEHDWTTASEIAEIMDTHVATAVKRLSNLYEIGILDRRVRKGKTRSAQEYSLNSTSIGLDIDLDELAGKDNNDPTDAYMTLLEDMARRFSKFSGRSAKEIGIAWDLTRLKDARSEELLYAISNILDAEAHEYGELTVKSLAAASLDAIGLGPENLPEKYFGVV